MNRTVGRWVVSAGIIVLFLWLALLAAPMQARYADYCHGKGGFYNYKSMQCISGDGIENMVGKNF